MRLKVYGVSHIRVVPSQKFPKTQTGLETLFSYVEEIKINKG